MSIGAEALDTLATMELKFALLRERVYVGRSPGRRLSLRTVCRIHTTRSIAIRDASLG